MRPARRCGGPVRGERLGQVISRPAPDRLDRGVECRVGRDDDDIEIRAHTEQRWNQIETILFIQPEIEKGEVEAVPAGGSQRGLTRSDGDHSTPDSLQAHRQRIADVLLVVYDERVYGMAWIRSW